MVLVDGTVARGWELALGHDDFPAWHFFFFIFFLSFPFGGVAFDATNKMQLSIAESTKEMEFKVL